MPDDSNSHPSNNLVNKLSNNLADNQPNNKPDEQPDTSNITSVLGFDYGKKRIGVASGQTITHTATPQITLKQLNGNPDWSSIAAQIKQWQPQALIVGMPYHLDGNKNAMTQAVEEFCNGLKKRYKLPLFIVDERHSSAQAEEVLKQNIKIGQHNKDEIDKMAAAVIVQRWLDTLGH